METKLKERLTWRVKEIAELTGLKEPFLRNEITRGNLKAIKRGRCVIVPDEELRRYIQTEGE